MMLAVSCVASFLKRARRLSGGLASGFFGVFYFFFPFSSCGSSFWFSGCSLSKGTEKCGLQSLHKCLVFQNWLEGSPLPHSLGTGTTGELHLQALQPQEAKSIFWKDLQVCSSSWLYQCKYMFIDLLLMVITVITKYYWATCGFAADTCSWRKKRVFPAGKTTSQRRRLVISWR